MKTREHVGVCFACVFVSTCTAYACLSASANVPYVSMCMCVWQAWVHVRACMHAQLRMIVDIYCCLSFVSLFFTFCFPILSPCFFFLWSLFLGTLFLHCFSGFSVFDRSLNYVKDFQSKPAKKLNTRCPPSWDNLHYKSMWINRDQRLKVLVSEVCTGTEMYGRCKIWSTTVDWKCQIQNQDIPK